MKTALIILVFIVLGLGGFYFYTTRYFRVYIPEVIYPQFRKILTPHSGGH